MLIRTVFLSSLFRPTPLPRNVEVDAGCLRDKATVSARRKSKDPVVLAVYLILWPWKWTFK